MFALMLPQDTRTHVVVELFNTEKSYVDSLETVVKVSMFSFVSINLYHVHLCIWRSSYHFRGGPSIEENSENVEKFVQTYE